MAVLRRVGASAMWSLFDRALERYLKNMTVVEDEMMLHSELAKYIVAVARRGERDEDRLATGRLFEATVTATQ